MLRPIAQSSLLRLAMGLAIATTFTGGLILGGCSDSSRTTAAASSLAATGTKVTDLKVNVNRTNTTLDAIKVSKDAATDFATLKEQIALIKTNATEIKTSYEQISTQTDAVVTAWKQEIAEVQEPTLRLSSAERSAKVTVAMGEIKENFRVARDAYQPYVATLDSVVTFLEKDLTPSGVKVAAPTMDKAHQTGIDLQVQLQLLSVKLDALSGQIAPAAK